MRPRALLLALATLLATRASARADERPARLVGLHHDHGWLGVSVGLRDLFTAADIERLRSGFVSRVLMRVELYREGEAQPLARADRHSDILYDLWDERFRVRVIDRDGVHEQPAVATDRGAIELATALHDFAVVPEAKLAPGIYRLRLRADLNPLSEDLVAEVRRWLVRPPGQGRGGAGDSFFGSFVSIFVNPQIEESERQMTFWSQPFTLQGGL